MKNKRTGIFLSILILIFTYGDFIYAKEIPDELKNLYARSAVLIDADSGRILFGKNEKDVLPMASTTKIMTCILALELMQNNEIAVASENAVKQPKVHLGVREGEQYYLKDLLYSLMLESHNDSAVIIAETIGGTVEKFADMMNEKAKDIGCNNTYFITPNGLDAEDEAGIHSTTAEDLALMMRYCIRQSPKREEFLKITSEETYHFKDADNRREFVCYNHNAFLNMMDGAISGKTGFTNDAGYCYVGALTSEGKTFIVALLACGWPNNKGYKWADTRTLMEYGIENYEYKNIDTHFDEREIKVLKGTDENNPLLNETYVKTEVISDMDDRKVLLHKEDKIEEKMIIQEKIYAPVKKGENLGYIYYLLSDQVIDKRKIVAKSSIPKRNIYNLMKCVFLKYCI